MRNLYTSHLQQSAAAGDASCYAQQRTARDRRQRIIGENRDRDRDAFASTITGSDQLRARRPRRSRLPSTGHGEGRTHHCRVHHQARLIREVKRTHLRIAGTHVRVTGRTLNLKADPSGAPSSFYRRSRPEHRTFAARLSTRLLT